MKTEEEIQDELVNLKADSRHRAKPALVHINAPLALMQVEIQAKIDALEWVLRDKSGVRRTGK